MRRYGRTVTVVLTLHACGTTETDPFAFLVSDALVLDGSGAPGVVTDVRIREGHIAEIGELRTERGEPEVDGSGLVLAPGFIDTHSHHDGGLVEMRDAVAAVSQGITTIVVGQDGGSQFPLADFFARLEEAPVAVNVASYAGHNSIRSQVMGEDYEREATDEEVETMRAVLAAELAAGALGLSTGLEYDPGIYSATAEVLALARETAAAGGRYISHMRSEDRAFFEALDELLQIGRVAGIPVQISHMKLAMKSLWGRADEALAILDTAREEGIDVSADVYPYEFWQSTMAVLFPEREFTHEKATFALEELAPPDGMFIARFEPNPDYVGMSLSQIAEARGKDAATVYLELIAEAYESGGAESIIARSMSAADISRLLAWPHTNVSSDGSSAGRHPRGYGAFTRVLAKHVRDRADFDLPEAIHKMTELAAQHMGLSDRGTISVGAPADLVLFDPERVSDRATTEDPNAPSIGIIGVWVNGRRVWDGDRSTGEYPGVVLRRERR